MFVDHAILEIWRFGWWMGRGLSFSLRRTCVVGVENDFANAIHVNDLLGDAATASRSAMMVDEFCSRIGGFDTRSSATTLMC